MDTEPNINPLISNLLLLDLFASMQQHNAIKQTLLISLNLLTLSTFGITSYNQEMLLVRNAFIKVVHS